MSKQILITGLERGDFSYYLSLILSVKGKVLVADNSFAGDLFRTICKDEEENVFEWKNITFTRSLDVMASNIEEFDYTVIYAGEDIKDKYDVLGEDSLVLAMPDYSALCLRQMYEYLPSIVEGTETMYILRDWCSKKISLKAIAAYLSIPPKAIAGTIPLSVKDMASYIAFTHNKKQALKGVSDDMMLALSYVATKVFDTEQKKAAKIIAKAKKIK